MGMACGVGETVMPFFSEHSSYALNFPGSADTGGRYDYRGAAINIWSHSWINDATHHDSTIIGSFYVHWADANCIYEVECDCGFALADLQHELALLEEAALGYVKHGVRRQ
jgi:hypothetical protein